MRNYEFAFLSSTTHPGFLNAPPLAGLPEPGVVIAGVAWDGATTNRPGSRFGPYAIRRASHMLCDGWHPLFAVSPSGTLADVGDLQLPNTSLAQMRPLLEAAASALMAKHHVVWLGGDHSITLSLLRAQHRQHARPLALVHFDAHCDTWPDHMGEPSGHGTWVREAIDEGLIEPQLCVQYGIRSGAHPSVRDYLPGLGGLVFSERDLRGQVNAGQLQPFTREFRERHAAAGHPPVYLSLDIDCLDPAFAPGTGTPEPGGLSVSQALTLLELLHDLPWAGMDLVEVSPPFDHAELTSNAAATLIWTYLCGRMAAARAVRA
jgi:agmatinase